MYLKGRGALERTAQAQAQAASQAQALLAPLSTLPPAAPSSSRWKMGCCRPCSAAAKLRRISAASSGGTAW